MSLQTLVINSVLVAVRRASRSCAVGGRLAPPPCCLTTHCPLPKQTQVLEKKARASDDKVRDAYARAIAKNGSTDLYSDVKKKKISSLTGAPSTGQRVDGAGEELAAGAGAKGGGGGGGKAAGDQAASDTNRRDGGGGSGVAAEEGPMGGAKAEEGAPPPLGRAEVVAAGLVLLLGLLLSALFYHAGKSSVVG